MAMLSKTNLFPALNCKQSQNQCENVSSSARSISGIGSMSFPCRKLKSPALENDFLAKRVAVQEYDGSSSKRALKCSTTAQTGLIGKAPKWWEKGVQPNMKEAASAQDLVDSLLNAGDKLVVVEFFFPGCGGCKALHPKICQLAEMNPDVQFLSVNYEEHKSMCHSLNVHVFPFFRFYRGAQGRVCSFSCTNSTIKKFKDALAKHYPDRCSLGLAKGLEEKELFALAANKDLGFHYTPTPVESAVVTEEENLVPDKAQADSGLKLPFPLPSGLISEKTEDKTLVVARR